MKIGVLIVLLAAAGNAMEVLYQQDEFKILVEADQIDVEGPKP